MSYQFDGSTAQDVICRFFGEFNPVYVENKEVIYKCNCSKRKIDKIVKNLGKTECDEIIADVGKIEVCCHFCGKKYVYGKDEIDKLFSK